MPLNSVSDVGANELPRDEYIAMIAHGTGLRINRPPKSRKERTTRLRARKLGKDSTTSRFNVISGTGVTQGRHKGVRSVVPAAIPEKS